MGDALSNGQLRALIRQKGYERLHLCGLDECGCVAATALGARKRGIEAEIIRDGTATVFDGRKAARMREKLRQAASPEQSHAHGEARHWQYVACHDCGSQSPPPRPNRWEHP